MYKLSQLEQQKGIFHVFSEKSDGSMSFKGVEINEIKERRRKFFGNFDEIHYEKVVVMRPFFAEVGSEIVIVTEKDTGRGIESPESVIPAEALITNTRGIALMLTVADCSPIILYDPNMGVLALIHASRLMTGQRIVESTLQKMVDVFHVKQKDLIVGIGPGIKRESYILDYVPTEFEQGEWESFIDRDESGKRHIDIPGINREMLINKGVSRETIEISPIDTARSDRFFSHYRDSRIGIREGFFATIVCLK